MKNVLLVDDDKVSIFLNSKLLQRTGLAREIHVAWNGKEALTLFDEYLTGPKPLPDIMFLDLSMPIMDGLQFLEAFSKLPISGKENVRIIVLSSSAEAADIEKAKLLGACRVLNKPLSERVLMQIMKS